MNPLEDVDNAKYLILDNLGKAIKVIQHHVSTEPGLTLRNESCMLQSLAHSLDLNLRHGLRNPHIGYWPLVKLVTHSATQQIINSLTAVHTSLGKGRAWLYLTLAEGSLESYLGCLSADKQELDKTYARHALMRDVATRDRLIRLVAAIQHVQFNLDVDVSYLETSTYKHQTLQMTSSVTSSLASPVDSGVASVDSDVDGSSATLSFRDDDSALREMDDSAVESTQTHTDASMEAVEDTSPNCYQQVNNKLLNSKREKAPPAHELPRKSMESLNKCNSGDTLAAADVCKSLTASDIANQNIELNPSCTSAVIVAKTNTDCDEIVYRRQRKKRNKHEVKVKRVSFHEDLITNPQDDLDSSSTFSASFLPANAVLKKDAVKGRYTWCGEGDTPYMSANQSEQGNTLGNSYRNLRSDNYYKLNTKMIRCYEPDDNEMLQMDSLLLSGPELSSCTIAEREGPEGQEDPEKTSSTFHLYSSTQAQPVTPSVGYPSDSQKSMSVLRSSSKLQSVGNLSDSYFKTTSTPRLYSSSVNLAKVPSMASSLDYLSDSESDMSRCKRRPSAADSQPLGRRMTMMDTRATLLNRFLRLVTAKKLMEKRAKVVKRSRSLYIAGVKSDYELNEELNVSLDAEIKTGRRELPPSIGFEVEVSSDVEEIFERRVFTASEEKLKKVFQVRSCYSVAGASTPLLVLLTDVSLYITGATDNYDYCNHLVLPYKDLDSILVGPNCQSLLLLAKDCVTQFLLATGDCDATQYIVSRIELAMRHKLGVPPAVKCVGLGDLATLKRSLVKQAAMLKTDELCHYSLVYLQDNQSSPPSTPLGPTKEGHLMYRSASQATPQPWTPGYFILKAGVVYLFEDKDHRLPKHVMMLSNGQCKGCRRLVDKRPHTFQVALGWARSIDLAASDEYQASDWLQAFIQASAGVYHRASVESTACSLVLTSRQIVTCLEQFPAGSATALSVANVADLTAFRSEHSWCVLEFACREVHESSGSGDWIVYFASANEMDSFETSLRRLWGRLKPHVEFPSYGIVEHNLLTRCVETGQLLHQAWDHLL